jgi:hypothetical protein
MLFLQCEGPTFTAIQNNWQNYVFVNFNFYIPTHQETFFPSI